jgi:hypothetical protein
MKISIGTSSLIFGLGWLIPAFGYEFNVGPSRYDPNFAQALSQKSTRRRDLWTPSSSNNGKGTLLTSMGYPIREPMRMMPQQTPMVPYMVSYDLSLFGSLRGRTALKF